MLGSPAFAWTCAEIERATALSELVARGTVRLALKQAGLEPQSVSGDEMAIVLREILPRELAARAVADAAEAVQRDRRAHSRPRTSQAATPWSTSSSGCGGGK